MSEHRFVLVHGSWHDGSLWGPVADRLIGAPGEGFKVAMATLDVFRPSVGAAALGFARRALDEALGRVAERELYGAPMAELELVQAKLGQMALGVDASALLVYRAAWTKDVEERRVSREAAMATLDVFRSTVGAAALGFARRALDEALDRVTARELFGAPMADLQLVQAKLADMALEVDASALLVYRAAWTADVLGGRVSREAAMAKLHATETAQRVVDEAVQLFGGLGVTVGSVVERLYREVRALRIYEGASEVQRLIIARAALAAAAEHRQGATHV